MSHPSSTPDGSAPSHRASPAIAVIGAGMAGISAARVLHDAGVQVTVFEKSRGFGGRCATKRWEGHVVDHGAQYFTIRDERFRAALVSACGEALKKIEAPILGPDGEPTRAEDRFFHAQGNSRLARELAGGLEVRLERPIGRLQQRGSRFEIDGMGFDQILSTAPWPQTRVLAEGGEAQARTAWEDSPYSPCLTAVFRYEAVFPGRTATAYAVADASDPVLVWSACENHKIGRIQNGSTVLVAQAGPDFSRASYDQDPAVWADVLARAVDRTWSLDGIKPTSCFTHRWRYARLERPPGNPPLPQGWMYAGDAIQRSRVECAWISGHQAAHALLGRL